MQLDYNLPFYSLHLGWEEGLKNAGKWYDIVATIHSHYPFRLWIYFDGTININDGWVFYEIPSLLDISFFVFGLLPPLTDTELVF